MTAPAFNPETGLLTAPRDTLAALATIVTGAREADAAAVDAVLAAAGAGSLAEPHPKLAEALAPMRSPIIGIRLGKSGYVMPGWVGQGRFTLHAYRGGDDDQLVPMPAEHLAHFLAWLLDIGPRPRNPRPPETAAEVAALDRALAYRLADRPSEGLLPEPLDSAIADGFRDWWLASSVWTPAADALGELMLEAVDTDAGLWSIQRLEDGATAIVRPVTPMSTFLALGDLLPSNHLIDASAPRLALERTPVVGGHAAWVTEALSG